MARPPAPPKPEPPLRPAPRLTRTRRQTARSAGFVSRLPAGALIACLIVLGTHLVVTLGIVTRPVPPERLRKKVLALTQDHRPSVLIAGDSRAEYHVRPATLAAYLDLTGGSVVNMAIRNCEAATALAGYREFAHRFCDSPIMVISPSFWSVNDHPSAGSRFINDETLWSMSLIERFRLATPRRAIMATFLPEKTLWRRLLRSADQTSGPIADFGFFGVTSDKAMDREQFADNIEATRRFWYADAETNGVRWRVFEESLQALGDAGVQVVILDAPEHPAFLSAIEGKPAGKANAQYHGQLAELADRTGIPLLRYLPDRFTEHDPDDVYFDLMHLNRTGALILSDWIGRDLLDLITSGRLKLPDIERPAA